MCGALCDLLMESPYFKVNDFNNEGLHHQEAGGLVLREF